MLTIHPYSDADDQVLLQKCNNYIESFTSKCNTSLIYLNVNKAHTIRFHNRQKKCYNYSLINTLYMSDLEKSLCQTYI